MASHSGGESVLIANDTKQGEFKNMAHGGRASSMMKAANWLCSTFGIQICSRLIGSKFEGKGESSMTKVTGASVKQARIALSEAGRAWVQDGKSRKGESRDRLVEADKRFRTVYFQFHQRLPMYKHDEKGDVVMLDRGPIYIDRDKITRGDEVITSALTC